MQQHRRFLILLAILPVVLYGTSVFFVALGFLLTLQLSIIQLLLAVGSTAYFAYWFAGKLNVNTQKLFLYFGLIFTVAILIASNVNDSTFDGQWYHQEAILAMQDGWIPPYQEAETEVLNYYPKAAYYAGAVLTTISPTVETGKAFQLMLMCSVYLLTLIVLSPHEQIANWTRHGLAVILTFHSIAINQSLSFYIDGEVTSMLTCLILFVWMRLTGKEERWIQFLLNTGIVCLLALLINIKMTAFLPLALLIGSTGLYFAVQRHWGDLLQWGKLYGLGLVIGFVVLGYHPFITSSIQYGHPFYPFNDPAQSSWITQVPKGLTAPSIPGKNLQSWFGKADNTGEGLVQPKFPFMIYSTEVKQFLFPDTRIAGFGPGFAGALVLTWGLICMLLAYKPKDLNWILAISGIWLFAALIFENGWYARYVPFLFYLPLFWLVFALIQNKKSLKIAGLILFGWLAINTITLSYDYVRVNLKSSRLINKQYADLQKQGVSLKIEQGSAHRISIEHRLSRRGISYEVVDKLECEDPMQFYGSIGKYCIQK